MGIDRSTLERLYDQEAEGIFRYALALAGCEGIARDILQEVFVKLARDGLSPEILVVRDPLLKGDAACSYALRPSRGTQPSYRKRRE